MILTPEKEFVDLAGKLKDLSMDKIDTQSCLVPDLENAEPQTKVRVLKRRAKNTYRRAFGETQLMDAIGTLDFKDGDSYHFISGGDVDALSYLKVILRQQDLDYCLFSTWCMAAEDIYQIHDWLDSGKIKRVDAYVGEIFPGSYRKEYNLLKPIIEKCGGRVAVFRNHSKIFAGTGPKFDFGVETSANINTNPRTENGCITIGTDIYKFYRDYFDGIISFEGKNEKTAKNPNTRL